MLYQEDQQTTRQPNTGKAVYLAQICNLSLEALPITFLTLTALEIITFMMLVLLLLHQTALKSCKRYPKTMHSPPNPAVQFSTSSNSTTSRINNNLSGMAFPASRASETVLVIQQKQARRTTLSHSQGKATISSQVFPLNQGIRRAARTSNTARLIQFTVMSSSKEE